MCPILVFTLGSWATHLLLSSSSQILSAEKLLQCGTCTDVNGQERKPGIFSVDATFHFQKTHKDLIQLPVFVLWVSNLWWEGSSELETVWSHCDRLADLFLSRLLTSFWLGCFGLGGHLSLMNHQEARSMCWSCVSWLTSAEEIGSGWLTVR